MAKIQIVKVLFLAALLIVGSEAKPVRGRKRAFGMGLLGGALAGAVVGGAVAKASSSNHKAAAPASPPVAQVVETGVPDRNGCYRQTVKEPMPGNPKLYTETVHLVCPNGQPAANAQPAIVVPAQVVPAQMHPAATYSVVAAPAAPVAATSNLTQAGTSAQSNATHTQTVLVHPGPASAAVAAPASASAPAASAPHSGLTIVYANAPSLQAPPQPAQPAQPGAAHVILLSKTVKKQKSAAPTLNVSHGLLILVIVYCLISK